MENKERIENLKIILNLIRDAYTLQNQADCLLYNHFIVDDNCKFLDDDFYKIKAINTSSPLYYKELETINLIKKLENLTLKIV